MVDTNSGGDGNGSPARPTPTLVEVNTRWHLTDFGPLTDACVGYNAVEETLSAYLDPERFEALPRVPPTGEDSRYGRVVHLVSFVEGSLEQILHEEVQFLTPLGLHSCLGDKCLEIGGIHVFLYSAVVRVRGLT